MLMNIVREVVSKSEIKKDKCVQYNEVKVPGSSLIYARDNLQVTVKGYTERNV